MKLSTAFNLSSQFVYIFPSPELIEARAWIRLIGVITLPQGALASGESELDLTSALLLLADTLANQFLVPGSIVQV